MIKQIVKAVAALVLLTALVACSSPEEKAVDYIENGNDLLEDGKLRKAEIEYRNALQINQNLSEAWFGLANIYELRQDWKKVYSVLSKIRELDPLHLNGRLMLGEMLLASDQLDQALSDAREIVEMAPADARSHSLMAAVRFRLDDLEGARKDVEKALAIDGNNPEALLVRARLLIADLRYEDALAVIDSAIENDPKYIPFYLMQVHIFTETDNVQAVGEIYLNMIDRFPDNSDFKQALIRHFLDQGDTDSAGDILQRVIETDPENVDAKLRFAVFIRQHRSLEEAIELVQSYINADSDEYRYRFLLGQLYEIDNQREKALQIFEAIVADDGSQPNGLKARTSIAMMELRAGNSDQALELVNQVLELDKSDGDALLIDAGIKYGRKEFDDAIVSLRTVLRDNPDSIKALVLLGQTYDSSGSEELAIESYTKAFQLSPGSPIAANKLAAKILSQRKVVLADEILQKTLVSGNRSIEALKLYAQIKLALGEWGKVEQIAKQLQLMEGQEAASLVLLGAAYQGQDRQQASIDVFKRAHELVPSASEPVVALVRSYMRAGKVDEARRFLDSIVSLDHDNVTANLLLGQLSLFEKDVEKAIRHFERIVESNPEMEIGYRNLAIAYLRQNETGKAEEVLERAVDSVPERTAPLISLASVYRQSGEIDKAIEIYRSLLEKDSDLLVVKNNLASLLTDHRNDSVSLNEARSVAATLKDSQILQFRDTYAWASVVAGTNLEEAVGILEQIVREDEQNYIYTYHLGEAYRRKGDLEKANAYLNKAVEFAGPESDIGAKATESLRQIQ